MIELTGKFTVHYNGELLGEFENKISTEGINGVTYAEPHEVLQVWPVQESTPDEACEQADSACDPGGPP